jgi:hypothetical protein
MKEFMLYIRNEKDAKKNWSQAQHLAFMKKCEAYIERLKNDNRLIAAQPIVREGVILKKKEGRWTEIDIEIYNETQVGYYHILSNDLEEAIEIAQGNPEFEYVPSASIEVRQVKTKENETGFVYPTQINTTKSMSNL